jgi:hypothetical protein
MMTTQTKLFWLSLLALVFLGGLSACAPQPGSSVQAISPTGAAVENKVLPADKGTSYLKQVSYRPAEAKYFDLINRTLALNSAEQSLLAQNGFVLTERLAYEDFTTAYAEIYRQDLPVLITTDSILQAVHQLHSELLLNLEESMFRPKLMTLLSYTHQQLQAEARANTDPELAPLYADLELYLAVPLALLAGAPAQTPDAAHYIELIQAANGVKEVDLFGSRRPLDFSLFQVRGHYSKSETLAHYFQAMSWLALIDFRLVEYDPAGQPQLQLEPIAAAALLRQALDKAGQRPAWEEFEALFNAFVGGSDNVTLPDLDRFLADAGVTSPADLLHPPAPRQLLARLSSGDYGRQRISAHIQVADPAGSTPVPPPISFMLLGQRFSLDSYLLNNLVYDRLVVDGRKVNRRLASPLDVMYALGNNRAATHLQSELTEYGYQDNLAALRREVEGYEPAFWTSSTYNRWLGALRELASETTGSAYPQAMRTSSWADKMLQTQLASWAQLRHDNILYIKQSLSGALCEYPAGYVEPYPRFYATVADYAQAQQTLLSQLDPARLSDGEAQIRQTAVTQFGRLAAAATQLQTLAEKELRLEPFSPAEEKFLKETAVHKPGDFYAPQWAGWYPELFLEYKKSAYQIDRKDKSPALIADIQTDPGDGLLQSASVLHVASGSVAALIFIADTDKGPTMYVGPALTYYEVVESGRSPQRLTDQAWRDRFSPLAETRPAGPAWTHSFRWSPEPAPANPWWLIGGMTGGVMGVITLGVYAAGIYSQQRRLLWLSSLMGIGIGLGLLVLAGIGELNLLNLMWQQFREGNGDYSSSAWQAYHQKPAQFSLAGLICLFVSLWSLAKSLDQVKPALSRHGRYLSVGAMVSLIGLSVLLGLSQGALLVVDSIIFSFGASLLIWLPLWDGVGYLSGCLTRSVLKLGSVVSH